MRPGETPVPIPNTTVKTRAADGTMLETAWESRRPPDFWGYSSAGRAPALQAGGQGFESPYLQEARVGATAQVHARPQEESLLSEGGGNEPERAFEGCP